jgi:hypothetical protein
MNSREFIYVEFPSRISFNDGFSKIVRMSNGDLPRSGGMLDEKRMITLPDETLLHGISYKGDSAGWRAAIQAFCNEQSRVWASVDSGIVFTSDGRRYPLDDCRVQPLA